MYSWVKHFANASCYINILIIIINGVRKYFDRQQSRQIFQAMVFSAEEYECRETVYTYIQRRQMVFQPAEVISIMLQISSLPHISLPSQQGYSRWSLACLFPHGCKDDQGKRQFKWSLSHSWQLAWTSSSSVPAETRQLALEDASAGKGSRFVTFASVDALRKACAFLGGVLFWGRKLEPLKAHIFPLCIRENVFFPFLFLRAREWGGFSNFLWVPQTWNFFFFSDFPPQEGIFF